MTSILISAFIGASFGVSSWAEPKYLLRVPIQQKDQIQFLKSKEFDFTEDFRSSSQHNVLVFASENQKSILEEKFNGHFQVVETAMPLREKLAKMQVDDIPVGYLDLNGIWDKAYALQRAYPTIVQVFNMTSFGPGKTYEGREIPMIKISDNVAYDEDEPNIMIVSEHHAREIITPHISLDTVERLALGYQSRDPEIIDIVDSNEIFVSPLWNPDGYDYVWKSNNMWRKNRKPVGNAYGVDQNRNYDAGWDTSCAGSSIPSSDTYKGPSPNSEEETQIMLDFSLKRNLVKMNDFHSYGREVLYSFLCIPVTSRLDSFMQQEATTLASKTTVNYATRRPSADGEHHQWNINFLSPYSFITETSFEFQPPFSDAQFESAAVWPMTKYFLQRTIPYSGHVYSSSGSPLSATISISGIPDTQFRTGATFGNFYIILPDGNYTITVSSQGYQNQVKQISINNLIPVNNQNIYLIN